MHVIVTGATGFIGRNVVRAALERGHTVTAIVRDEKKARDFLPAKNDALTLQICSGIEEVDPQKLALPDDAAAIRLIHLAWNEVGKYNDPGNFLANVAPQFEFLKRMAEYGITRQTIAGSCLEYGKTEGAMQEDRPPQPVTYYGLAKITLYNMLRLLSDGGLPLSLNWLRYFYVYGAGQRAQALLPQLYAAIARGDKVFNMSQGDQLRDFIYVGTLAHNTVVAAEQPVGSGILNVGNGRPVRVKELVEAAKLEKKSDISLNTGFYGYPAYEPFSFHADINKLSTIPNVRFDDKFVL